MDGLDMLCDVHTITHLIVVSNEENVLFVATQCKIIEFLETFNGQNFAMTKHKE